MDDSDRSDNSIIHGWRGRRDAICPLFTPAEIMIPMTEVALLQKHRQGSDDAFEELVRRHAGWIYGVAFRRTRDSHAAEDVVQAVFVLLHRKSPQFGSDRAIMSWLHKTTRYAAASAIRSRVRRIRHESRAAVLRIEAVPAINAGEWDGRLPMLDELVGRLSRADREVILLRYYRQMAFADVGVQIGTTAEAARKRVDRAVEKLRVIANQSGWALSATLLREGLSRHVVVGPPGGLPARIAMTVSHNVGSAIGASTAAIVKGAGAMMVSAQLKLVAALVAGIVIVGGAATLLLETNDLRVSAAIDPFPKLSPFSAVRWDEVGYRVRVDGKWYDLAAIDGLPASKIIDFARSAYPPDLWQKRVDEDLVEVMARMGATPGNTVILKVRDVDGRELITLPNVAMTSANRWAVWEQRNKPGGAPTTRPLATTGPAARVDLKVSPFSAVRWVDAGYQVEVRARWYELVSLDNVPVSKLLSFARQAYRDLWQKRIDEDLPEVLAALGHAPRQTVTLELRPLDTHEAVMLANVPMTAENRRAIWEQRRRAP